MNEEAAGSDGPLLLIRADGGAGIGNGHVVRCLSVAQEWVSRGGRATFLTNALPRGLSSQIAKSQVTHLELPATALGVDEVVHQALKLDPSWILIDGYNFGDVFERSIVDSGWRLAVFDDHGATRRHLARVIVDQNLDATAANYSDRSVDSDLLLGTKYAALRQEFNNWRDHDRTSSQFTSRLIVMLGGSPPAEVTDTVKEAVSLLGLAANEITWIAAGAPRTEMAALLGSSEVALSAAGSVCWELCLLGVPSVLMPIAANQVPVAAALARHGAAFDAGANAASSPDALAALVRHLLSDEAAQAQMSDAARGLVDGKGAARIVRELKARSIRLRRATSDDADLYWVWANDPSVRSVAFSRETIPWEDHISWFTARLVDADCLLYLAEDIDTGAPVGQVRFESTGSQAEISLSLDPSWRGRGLGAPIIAAASNAAFIDMTIELIIAHVLPDNVASARAFEAADFAYEGTETVERQLSRRYVRRRGART